MSSPASSCRCGSSSRSLAVHPALGGGHRLRHRDRVCRDVFGERRRAQRRRSGRRTSRTPRSRRPRTERRQSPATGLRHGDDAGRSQPPRAPDARPRRARRTARPSAARAATSSSAAASMSPLTPLKQSRKTTRSDPASMTVTLRARRHAAKLCRPTPRGQRSGRIPAMKIAQIAPPWISRPARRLRRHRVGGQASLRRPHRRRPRCDPVRQRRLAVRRRSCAPSSPTQMPEVMRPDAVRRAARVVRARRISSERRLRPHPRPLRLPASSPSAASSR